jgi:hypothetical protein
MPGASGIVPAVSLSWSDLDGMNRIAQFALKPEIPVETEDLRRLHRRAPLP